MYKILLNNDVFQIEFAIMKLWWNSGIILGSKERAIC